MTKTAIAVRKDCRIVCPPVSPGLYPDYCERALGSLPTLSWHCHGRVCNDSQEVQASEITPRRVDWNSELSGVLRDGNGGGTLLKMFRSLVLLSLVGGLVGCDLGFFDTYWRSGDYELIAIDVKGAMDLSVDLHNDDAIALVGPTVFSLGANSRYIVVQQHPATDHFGSFNRAVTNYFVITRLPGSALEKEKGVRGPMNKTQFEQLSRTLSLPPFTKTFVDLR